MNKSDEVRRRQVAEVERLTRTGQAYVDACRSVGIPPSTFFRWKRAFAVTTGQVIAPEPTHERLATFSSPLLRKLKAHQQTRVRRQIADLCISVFGRPPSLRLRRHYPELERLARQVERAIKTFDGLSAHLKDHVVMLCEPVGTRRTPYAELLERLRRFPGELRTYAKALEQHAVELGDAGGGPDRDPRIGQFVSGLAAIYQSTTGFQPTHRISTDTGKAISHFNRFGRRVARHFLSEIRIPPTALDRAMRDAAARIDWGGRKPPRRKLRLRIR